MAGNNVTTIQQVEDDVRRGYADAASFYRDNLNAAIASSQAVIRGMQAVSSETLAFYQARMKESIDVGGRLIACRDPGTAWETQVDFARASFQAYAEEFTKVADLTGRLVSDSLSPLAARTGEVENVAAKAAAA